MSNMAIQHNYYHGDLLILGNVMVYAEERLPTWKLKYLANASTREFSDVVNLIRESWNYNFPNPREREIAYLEKMAAILEDLTGQMTPSHFSTLVDPSSLLSSQRCHTFTKFPDLPVELR
jgi:hypothetical protein